MGKKTVNDSGNRSLMELLRTRFNVLNTSVFLLADKIDTYDAKTSTYLNRINRELERIRELITRMPESDEENS